jgi:hypothetical protein
MRIVFLVVLLAGAVFYATLAFTDLAFLTRTGRLGPGFFPRIIGVAAVVMILWSLIDALRAGARIEGAWAQWRDAAVLIGLALGYAVMLRLFGGFVATFLFLAVTLSVINPGRWVSNAAVAVLIPGFVYLLFDQLLNANMPPALFALPL